MVEIWLYYLEQIICYDANKVMVKCCVPTWSIFAGPLTYTKTHLQSTLYKKIDSLDDMAMQQVLLCMYARWQVVLYIYCIAPNI